MIEIVCKTCGTKKMRSPSHVHKNNFCSPKCLHQYEKTHPLIPWNKGIKGWTATCGAGFQKGHGGMGGGTKKGSRVSPKTEFKKGVTPWNKGKSGIMTAWNKGIKTGAVPWNKGKEFTSISGPKHWNWQGGKSNKLNSLRKTVKYKAWRKAVYERDNYTCVECGSNKSNTLNADHIKPFAYFPELRFELSNGRTLCVECHKKTETYMNQWIYKRNEKTYANT